MGFADAISREMDSRLRHAYVDAKSGAEFVNREMAMLPTFRMIQDGLL